jgi:hypothetical protein
MLEEEPVLRGCPQPGGAEARRKLFGSSSTSNERNRETGVIELIREQFLRRQCRCVVYYLVVDFP